MKARGIAGRILIVASSVLMLALSATLAWATVIDYQAKGLVTKGVTVVGNDLTGMSEPQARAAIEEAVAAPMMRPLTVAGDSRTWTLDPHGMVSVDVDSMLDMAYAPKRAAPLVSRLTSQLGDKLLPADIGPMYSVDSTAVAAWVGQTAAQVDRKPVDATRRIVKYEFKVTPEVYGAKVDRSRSTDLILQSLTAEAALSSSSRVTTLSIRVLKPKVLKSSFKLAIIVSLPQCRIRLYDGAKLVKSYRCAPGQPAWPTPAGDFEVVSKLRYSSWFNPHMSWSANMPEVIGPGPDNPMGVTKIGIDSPGVFMHGIPPGEFGSIGTHASHGCIRMMPSDALDLFGRVKIGTPVFIRD